MKKLLCAVMCIILLSGCKSEKPRTAPVVRGIEFTAEISSDAGSTEFNVTVHENGDTEMKSHTGLSYLFTPSSVTVGYNGLEYKYALSELSEHTFIDFIYSVFASVAEEAPTVHDDGDNYYVSGSTDRYGYKLCFGESGIPLSAEDSEKGIELKLTGVEPIASDE